MINQSNRGVEIKSHPRTPRQQFTDKLEHLIEQATVGEIVEAITARKLSWEVNEIKHKL